MKRRIYILMHGYQNESHGMPIAAFTTKKRMEEFVKNKGMRGTSREYPTEMYWEHEYEWMRCDEIKTDLYE
jgi:hypothetical protein